MNEPKYNNLTFTGKLTGSTGVELFKNKSEKKWVVKKASKGGGFEQTKIESFANDIYELLGIPVPKHKLDIDNKALILEYINGVELGKVPKFSDKFKKVKTELQKGFVVDALLANHDVIGLHMDNILVPADGSDAVRIDNGGSFIFRASGKKKPFSEIVSELDTMRNKEINPSAALIFGDITDTEIIRQIKEIIEPHYDEILIAVKDTELYDPLMQRLDYLIEYTAQFINTSGAKASKYITDFQEYAPKNNNASKYNISNLLQYISDKVINKIVKYTINIDKPNNIKYTEIIVPPIIKGTNYINIWDLSVIKYYSSIGYPNINAFMLLDDYEPQKLASPIYEALYKKFITTNIFPSMYNEILMYYYFVNLYNCIQKTPRVNKPFMVIRGTKTWYLPETVGKFSYLSGFTSTTTDINVAKSFSNVNNGDYKFYIFYVHPLCQFMNISKLSMHTKEQEILFNPYNKISYIETDGNKQIFAILPTDLEIPDEYDLFIGWKTRHLNMTGGFNGIMSRKITKGHLYKPTRKYISNKKVPERRVTKRRVPKRVLSTGIKYSKEFIDRVMQPISTFQGNNLTDDEQGVINQLIKYFKD